MLFATFVTPGIDLTNFAASSFVVACSLITRPVKITSAPFTWYSRWSNTPYQGSIARLCWTWLGIEETFGFVVLPAFAAAAPKVKVIDPAKNIVNKNLRRLARVPMEVLLSSAITGRHS